MRRGSASVLATVLFTDIVRSSEIAAGLGDEAWGRLLARHHESVRETLKRHRGREMDTAGDGFFAVFDHSFHPVPTHVRPPVDGARRGSASLLC